eukprot:gb/GEZN01005213.1/.p1 GENE.gb/GEZN01005213.1/~~gb/GEZN01005213.1/.p1  ORF type:complete len:491 (-),score=90.24 gb/GEZN01005213.1/:250-1722(-)
MPPKKKGKTKKEAGAKGDSKGGKGAEGKSESASATNSKIVHHEKFDLQGYVNKYKGHGRAMRLSFIADHCPEKRDEAFRLLIEQLKTGIDTTFYSETCQRAGAELGAEYQEDASWVGTTNRHFIEKKNQLENALQHSRRDEEIRPIRRCIEAIADLNFERGELNIALQRYTEAANMGFGSDEADRLKNYIKTIKTGIAIPSYSVVDKTYRMAKRARKLADFPDMEAQVNAAYGLWNLYMSGSADYASTARAFFSVSKEIKDFNDVIIPEDVVTYGCLAALASLTRRDIQRAMEQDKFRQMLEFRPDFSQILQHYLQSKYSKVFEMLEGMRKDLLLDPFLHKHVPKLYLLIRERAIMQYFRAFTTVNLDSMAKVMGLKVPELQTHLANLIGDGRMQARIDSANKVVYARSADQRDADYGKALQIGTLQVRTIKTMLMKISLSRNGLVVTDTDRRGKGDGESGVDGAVIAGGPDGGGSPIHAGFYEEQMETV